MHFCTYFDENYLVRGLALYRSLQVHCNPFVLWVLCFDEATYGALSKLAQPDLRPVSLEEFEEGDQPLMHAKRGRSSVEYYFTCTPSWPLYLLKAEPGIETLSYVDADYLFYSCLQPALDEVGERSIGIIRHRFPPRLRKLEVYGVFNVGLLVMRNDVAARECLNWWRERCLEWCYDRVEPGRFADQKYLDDFPRRFSSVGVIEHKGVGLAPWNWMNYRIAHEGNGGTIDGQPLIAYHFHGLRLYGERFYDVRLARYGRMPHDLRRWIYGGYVNALHSAQTWAGNALPESAKRAAPIRAGHGLHRLAIAAARRDLVLIRRGRRSLTSR